MFSPEPQSFDILGLATFGFILSISIWGLRTKKPFPRWVLFILLLIGILGIFIDGTIVYITYLR